MSVPDNGLDLKTFRKRHGLSQTELGALLPDGGLSQPRVSAIESDGAPLTDEQRAALLAWVRRQRGTRGDEDGSRGGGPRVPKKGNRLKALRKQRAMTQVQMAKILDISQPFLSQIETNDWEVPPDALRRLRAWVGGVGGVGAPPVEDHDQDDVELPWPVPRVGQGLERLLKQLEQEGDRKLTRGAVANGCGIGLPSLNQYTYLPALPKKFITKLKKFLAKHA